MTNTRRSLLSVALIAGAAIAALVLLSKKRGKHVAK